MQNNSLLARIKDPSDLQSLTKNELVHLAEEIRGRITEVVSRNGGHLASNLGVVELTLALHLVFQTPKDSLVWDVGHQAYTHKLLTGRNDAFDSLRKKGGLSGFPKGSESPHDAVETGHSSTSISSALGILSGRELLGREGAVVAIIGDGAMTGGMAFEALNHAGHLHKQLIVILNDNAMSISKNVGALSRSQKWILSSYLSRLSATRRYQRLREKIDRGLQGFPLIGMRLFDLVVRLKKGVKAVLFKESIFSDLGFEYVGPIDGHSISRMCEVLRRVKGMGKPTVVHVVTHKGRGYPFAEGDPTRFHGISPFSIEEGKVVNRAEYTFTAAFSESLTKAAAADGRLTAVTAAMEKGTGLSSFKQAFPDRFFDVGIAEQHALAFAAGLARAGSRPVAAVYSTFMQRAVDQVIHDIALPSLPVIMALDRSGVVGDDGETHQGIFDIPLFRSVPNLSILAPASREEVASALDYALSENSPQMIRYPKAPVREHPELAGAWTRGRGVLRGDGGEYLIATVGGLYDQACEAQASLAERGIRADLYNLRFIKPVDEAYTAELFARYRVVFAVEDGCEQGGIGEYLVGMVHRYGLSLAFAFRGVPDRFYPQAGREELLEELRLDGRGIAAGLSELIDQHRREAEAVSPSASWRS